jgi:hypothetical protein
VPKRCLGVAFSNTDRVSGDMLHRSDSFNGNGFASGKLLWRSEKLVISDGAASSSGDIVICLSPLWWLLRWCRRRRIGAGFLHRFIKIGMYMSCNLILSDE